MSRPRKPTPRAGTKQALMIDMLKRPEGATVEQIAAATGWQHHTIRGAISGALKKKLGLTVEATRTREVGPNKTGAKGSTTVYRIVEPTRRLVRRRPSLTREAPSMHGPLKRPGYRLHPSDSPEAGALLAEQGLGPTDLDRLSPASSARGHHDPHHRRDQRGRCVRHQPEGLAPGPARRLLRALHSAPLGKVQELLGRVPEGSTARFVKDGTLPGEARCGATAYRMAS